MKTKLFSALVLLTLFAGIGFAQSALSSTTLSKAVGTSDDVVMVASASGISGWTSAAGYRTMLFVDQEAFLVRSVSSTKLTVLRAQDSTPRQSHASGAKVWFGAPSYFAPADPVGACSSTSWPVTPLISKASGTQFTCTGSVWVKSVPAQSYSLSDGYLFVPPARCQMTAATTAWDTGASPALVLAAANNLVLQATTDVTAGTVTVTCPVEVPTRLTSGKGATLTAVSLLYGVQTTAVSSIAAANLKSVTYPAAGGNAAGTVSSALGGSLTVTPGTLQKTTTTSGQCFHEKIVLGTPVAMNTDSRAITLEQVFTTAGTTKTTLQVCGVIAYFTNSPL